jgi:hypothetical protein
MKTIGKYVMRLKKTMVFGVLALGLFTACDEGCNDCLDLAAKTILVVDASGTNLLFGSTAVYNPENVVLRSADGEEQAVFIDENTNTLQFFLQRGMEEYELVLSEDMVDTLAFELTERKSERCCGTQTVSTSTSLNGARIENSDLITIVK